MRIFTAIPVPQSVKDQFLAVTSGKLPIPYVNTTNFHITLNFLGEVDTDQLIELTKWWEGFVPTVKPFKVEFAKLAKFGHQIHMVVKENAQLVALQDQMTAALLKLGHKPAHHEFYGHLTVGTMHMDKLMNAQRKLDALVPKSLESLSFVVDKIGLYESKLLLHHVHHRELLTKLLNE